MIQNLMIDRVQLGSARGTATVWIRKTADGSDHRGSFWFRAEHEEEVQRLVSTGAPVELVGWVAGERRRIMTRLVSAQPAAGTAIFEGAGELMLVEDLRSDVAG
jgi:hypothetical protein